ncbi:MAG: helix-turn-helix domain-containing protein [Hyphomicrobiaceae bacterium]
MSIRPGSVIASNPAQVCWRWRQSCGFTLDEAAAALGISRSRVAEYDRSAVRGRGTDVTPPCAVRVLMRAISSGQVPEPWPE